MEIQILMQPSHVSRLNCVDANKFNFVIGLYFHMHELYFRIAHCEWLFDLVNLQCMFHGSWGSLNY